MKKKVYIKRETKKTSFNKPDPTICENPECKLRKAGCKGFEGCPGYKRKT